MFINNIDDLYNVPTKYTGLFSTAEYIKHVIRATS
jgi:hypothetical protein